MPVIWKPQMSTGNDLIDQDHRYLICLFNSVELALSRDDLLHHLPLFFAQLFDYTKEHFDREERIQVKIKYPHYLEHKAEHQKIVIQLERVNSELQQLLEVSEEESPLEVIDGPEDLDQEVEQLISEGAPPDKVAAIRAALDSDILALARSWVIDHIIKTDRDMIDYLKPYPANFQC